MGNVVGKRGRRSIKVMTMEGHAVKIRPPATVADVLNKRPGYVLLHSADVRQHGVRATPLPPSAELLPRNVYILMQAATLMLPQQHRQPRLRTASDVSASMSALERLDSLLLQRRCLSDIAAAAGDEGEAGGSVRVKLRLSKAELATLMARSSASAAGSSEDDSFSSSSCSSASHSGSLRPVKPALRGVSERCKSPHSQGNRVRFQQQQVC